MNRIKLFFVATSIFLLSSCSYIYGDRGFFQSRDTSYLQACSISPLNIPPGLASSTIQAHYPVAQRHYPACARKVNITPPELSMKEESKPKLSKVETEQQSIARQQAKNLIVEPNYYFDHHTRSSVAPGKIINTVQKTKPSISTSPVAQKNPENTKKPIQQAKNTTGNLTPNSYTDRFAHR